MDGVHAHLADSAGVAFYQNIQARGVKACRQTLRFTSNGLYSCPEVLEQSATKLLKFQNFEP